LARVSHAGSLSALPVAGHASDLKYTDVPRQTVAFSAPKLAARPHFDTLHVRVKKQGETLRQKTGYSHKNPETTYPVCLWVG